MADEKKPYVETDPDKLLYPRHLHRGEEACQVDSAEEAKASIKEGWTVEYVSTAELADRAKKAARAADAAPVKK